MTITLKYGIGSKVWTIDNCKAVECEVTAIHITPNGVYYSLKEMREIADERDCFVTKNELIEHISNG